MRRFEQSPDRDPRHRKFGWSAGWRYWVEEQLAAVAVKREVLGIDLEEQGASPVATVELVYDGAVPDTVSSVLDVGSAVVAGTVEL